MLLNECTQYYNLQGPCNTTGAFAQAMALCKYTTAATGGQRSDIYLATCSSASVAMKRLCHIAENRIKCHVVQSAAQEYQGLLAVADAAYLDVSEGIGKAGSASEAQQYGVAAPSQQHLRISSEQHEFDLQDPASVNATDSKRLACLCSEAAA